MKDIIADCNFSGNVFALTQVKKKSFLSDATDFQICKETSLDSNNKTISDGGITVDFSIIKVHTSN